MSQTPTQTIVCKECQFANEPERVYCHSCGAKLDRSVLPKEENIKREDPDRARKRIMRMANPGASVIKRELSALIKTLAFAAVIAASIQMARSPDGVNAPPTKASDALLSSELGGLATGATSRAYTFTEGDFNNAFKSKMANAGKSMLVQYKRSFVLLGNGTAQVLTEKAIYNFPMYIGTKYRLEGHNGTLAKTLLGGNIGRLQIHPLIMERLNPMIFGTLFEAMKREWESLGKMQSVVIRPGEINVVSKGQAPKE